MKRDTVLITIFMLASVIAIAQVGINTDNSAPDPSAMLDVKSANKGLLPPRLTTLQRDQVPSPSAGLVIFNTDCAEVQFFNGTVWKTLGNSAGQIASPAGISGNTGLCAQATGVTYSAAPVQDATSYSWTVPAGASITSGQGSNGIMVNFGTTGGSVCVTANNACYNSAPTCLAVNVNALIPASVTISTESTTVCTGTMATFTTNVVYGGSSPQFQWKKNNLDIPGATTSMFSYVPENNDQISCRMVSSGACAYPSSVYSNYITMTVVSSVPGAPTEGTPVPAPTEITWKWNTVTDATGYKWSTANDFLTATDMGTATNKLESGLVCNTAYTRYAWAYNSCGNSTPTTLTASTITGPSASVSIAASANPFCAGTAVTFTATPVNGGTTPAYQWKKNVTIVTGATNATYVYAPANGDSLRCQLTSNATCAQNNPAWSNMVTIAVNPNPVTCPFICGTTPLTISHSTTGGVAPVNKTTTYGTVTNIPGEATKCWITSNLGSDHQATAVNDATEASAGWYWQFNRKQGY